MADNEEDAVVTEDSFASLPDAPSPVASPLIVPHTDVLDPPTTVDTEPPASPNQPPDSPSTPPPNQPQTNISADVSSFQLPPISPPPPMSPARERSPDAVTKDSEHIDEFREPTKTPEEIVEGEKHDITGEAGNEEQENPFVPDSKADKTSNVDEGENRQPRDSDNGMNRQRRDSEKKHEGHRTHSDRKHSHSEGNDSDSTTPKRSKDKPPKKWNYSDSEGEHKLSRQSSSERKHHSSSKRNSSSSNDSPVKKHRHSSEHHRSSSSGSTPEHGSNKNKPVKHSLTPPTTPTTPIKRGHDVGDLVWGRVIGSSFHPALITKDPHYKFHTKIVKSETGSAQIDPETKKVVASPDAIEPARQYHLQFLGDNRRMWLPGKQIIPYNGITAYENLAIKDVKNIKLYRPKTEALKSQWREAVLIAKHLETLEAKERVRKCDHSRLSDLGDKALQRKIEYEQKVDKEIERQTSMETEIKREVEEPFKSPSQEKKGEGLSMREKERKKEREAELQRRKSQNYRRREEMDYKMHRIASAQDREKKEKREKEKKEKINSKEKLDKSKDTPCRVMKVERKVPSTPNSTTNTSISSAEESPQIDAMYAGGKEGGNNLNIGNGEVPVDNTDHTNENAGNHKPEDKALAPGPGQGGDGTPVKSVSQLESDSKAEGLGEGALVWAKMRGYPFWPSLITRDPHDGEFVKTNDGFYKKQNKIHVLFLEYQNQRAWVPTTSVVKYEGRENFEKDRERATGKKKCDYIPGKRNEEAFNAAVDFAEDISSLTDEARLEKVLLKYGWVMVSQSEPDSESDNGSPVRKKRRIEKPITSNVFHEEKVVAKSDNSEDDVEMKDDLEEEKVVEESKTLTETRQASVDRRSSAEAENRLDPAMDEPGGEMQVTPQTTNETKDIISSDNGAVVGRLQPVKRKRESSKIASIAMDVHRSSDSDSSEDENTWASVKKTKIKPPRPQAAKKKSAARVMEPVKSEPPVKEAIPVADDGGPQLGDLVWGRMAGFPFWPSFVTRSPEGLYRREGKVPGKPLYHVQFFNWNDESGWVNATLEFDGLDQFKKLANKHKKDKSRHPKGALTKKWEKAATDAEETLGLSRQERLEQFLVSYGPTSVPAPAVKVTTPKSTTPKPASKKPVEKKASSVKKLDVKKEVSKRVPMYKSVPASIPGVKEIKSETTINSDEDDEPLPPGWKIKNRTDGVEIIQTFISPEGKEFPTKSSALRHIDSLKPPNLSEDKAKYFEDHTLPDGWKCQRVQRFTANSVTSDIFYWSPKGERFRNRKEVADQMQTDGFGLAAINRVLGHRPAPKSVLLERGYDVENGDQIPRNLDDCDEGTESTSEEEGGDILRLPNGSKYRRGGPMDDFLDLDKLFDPTNGGIIEMVQLPDIFLDHPTVSVTESDNEMVISDVDTGEFIAKKIIYD